MSADTREGDNQSVEEIIEILDIELFCKTSGGGRPPKAKRYKIRVDKEYYIVDVPSMTGRQILELVGKVPPEHWMLNQKLHKGHVKPIALDEIVDFTAHGVERFMTLPKDQTEGRSALRRQFVLPEEDVQALEADGLDWEAIIDGNNAWVIIRQLILPPGLAPNEVSVAVQIPIGYPAAMLDMAYFHPAVARIDGRPIPGTEATVQIEGVPWQRWSRHYTQANPWKPGEYNVATHLSLVNDWLAKAAPAEQ